MATKRDLTDKIAKNLTFLDTEDASIAVNAIFDYIKDELIKENRIEIRGFGSFSVRKRKYAGTDKTYNAVYYRMSKNVQSLLNK